MRARYARRSARTLVGLVAASLLLACAQTSVAQSQPPPIRMARVELGGGIGWVGQSDVGTRDATLTSNLPGNPDPFRLFKVNGKTQSGPVASLWIGVNVTSSIGVEAVGHYSRPSLRATLSQDAEGAPNTTLVAQSFAESALEGNVLYHFNRSRFDNSHTVPFVLIGAGSFLQRKKDEGIEETGYIYQAGIGFKWSSRIDRARRARGLGLRLDVRYVLRDGGVDFSNDKRHSFVAGSATTTVGF